MIHLSRLHICSCINPVCYCLNFNFFPFFIVRCLFVHSFSLSFFLNRVSSIFLLFVLTIFSLALCFSSCYQKKTDEKKLSVHFVYSKHIYLVSASRVVYLVRFVHFIPSCSPLFLSLSFLSLPCSSFRIREKKRLFCVLGGRIL